MWKLTDIRAVGRERTEEEKLRRHIHGDKGAKFSAGKQLCLLGDTCGTVTTFVTKDCLICEIYEETNIHHARPAQEVRGMETGENSPIHTRDRLQITTAGRRGNAIACAMRGRSEGEWNHSEHRQTFEFGEDISYSITSVQKDSLICEIYD